MAGTNFPFGTGTGIGKNWVEKGSGIGNSPEFSGIPLGKHNQGPSSNPFSRPSCIPSSDPCSNHPAIQVPIPVPIRLVDQITTQVPIPIVRFTSIVYPVPEYQEFCRCPGWNIVGRAKKGRSPAWGMVRWWLLAGFIYTNKNFKFQIKSHHCNTPHPNWGSLFLGPHPWDQHRW